MKSSSNLIHFSVNKKEDYSNLPIKDDISPNNKSTMSFIVQNFLESNLNDIKDELNKKILKFQYGISSQIEDLKQNSTKVDTKYLLNLITEQKLNYEKIPEISQKLEKMEDKLNVIDISNSAMRVEFEKACRKYDNIFINNLQAPGKIGLGCKYKNLREFFFCVIDDMKNLFTFKEQCLREMKSKQEKAEKILELTKKEIEVMRQSNLLYLSKTIDPFEKKLEDKLVDFHSEIDKLNSDCIQNSYDTIKLENEIKKIGKDIDLFKVQINEENAKSIDEKIKSYFENRNQNLKINNEFLTIKGVKKPLSSEKIKKTVKIINHRNSFELRTPNFLDLEETKKPEKNNNILKNSFQIPEKHLLKKEKCEKKTINITPEKSIQKIDNRNFSMFEDKLLTHTLSIVNKNRQYYLDVNETNLKDKYDNISIISNLYNKEFNNSYNSSKIYKSNNNTRKNQQTLSSSPNNEKYEDIKESKKEIEGNKNNLNNHLSSIKRRLHDNKRYTKNELVTESNVKGRGKTNIHINDITNNFFINNTDSNINTISSQFNNNRKLKLRNLEKNPTEQNLKNKLLPHIFENKNNSIAYKDLVVSFYGEKDQIKGISEKKLSASIKKKHNSGTEKLENIIQNNTSYNSSSPFLRNDQNKTKKRKKNKSHFSMEKIPFAFKKTMKMQYKKNK